jgi:hypothetical protein
LGHFLQALDFKILEWVLPASQGLGDAFRYYGDLRYRALGGGEGGKQAKGGDASQALADLFEMWLKAEAQYARVVIVAADQGVNNPTVEESKERLLELARVGMLRAGKEFNALEAHTRRSSQGGAPEEKIRMILEGTQELAALHSRTLRYVNDFLEVASKASIEDTSWIEIRKWVLRGYSRRALLLQEAESIALQAATAAAADSVERLLLAGQLAVEVLGGIAVQAESTLVEGARMARELAPDSMMVAGGLGFELGGMLWRRGRFLDSLAMRSLELPPIPIEYDSVQGQPFRKKFIDLGMGLRDSSQFVMKRLVQRATDSLVPQELGTKAFAECALAGHCTPDSLGNWKIPWVVERLTRDQLQGLRVQRPLKILSSKTDKRKEEIHDPPSP